VEVTNVTALASLMDEMGVDYRILSDTSADVYAKLGVSELALKLEAKGCEIISMTEHDESLESFYIGLVGR
jgi:hypothetical protein